MNDISPIIETIQRQLTWLPPWFASVVLLVLGALVAWWVHELVFRLVMRHLRNASLFKRSVVSRTRGPTRLAFLMIGIVLAASVAPLSRDGAGVLQQIMLVGIIVLLGWIALTALHIWTVLHLRRFKLDSTDNLLARKHVTQTRILQRVAAMLIVLVTISAALMTFEGVRQYGVSLLASAGAAGIVVGLALQPILKNLVAGVQLALTQPIRIDDALLVENEWGNVEEIRSTYVVVRLWDWRRLIVPLSYFMEKPFQNWTHEGSEIIGSAFLYTDFTVPVPELRQELERIVRETPLWDGRVVNLQVTDLKENTMEIRILVSAENAGKAFELRCYVREKMIGFLQKQYPNALPRVRMDLVSDRPPAPDLH
ncbi:mechanosensitive ion channel family protein [Rhodoligotrophos defluvii]|uniref:mechanosensitive ion channel family protein n=1 Tax=Rhodoligotrophos defluvii TaxID=2561934 RepID=UPI0010C9D4E8|nr:mechanosensitive ion channel family protein [Rhodoligotrophos defluvii]